MKNKGIKTNYSLTKEIRKYWIINPKTRVKEDQRKDKKKRRNKEKKMINDFIKKDHFFYLLSI